MLALALFLSAIPLDAPVASPPASESVRFAKLLDTMTREEARPTYAGPTLGVGLGLTAFAAVLTGFLATGNILFFGAVALLMIAPLGGVWLIGEIIAFAVTASERADVSRVSAQRMVEARELALQVPGGLAQLEAWRDAGPARDRPSIVPGLVLLGVGLAAIAAGGVAFFLLPAGGPAVAGLAMLAGSGAVSSLLAIPLLAHAADARSEGEAGPQPALTLARF